MEVALFHVVCAVSDFVDDHVNDVPTLTPPPSGSMKTPRSVAEPWEAEVPSSWNE